MSDDGLWEDDAPLPEPPSGPRPGVLRYSVLFGVTMTASVGVGIAIYGKPGPLPLLLIIAAMAVNIAIGSHLSVLLSQGVGYFRQ